MNDVTILHISDLHMSEKKGKNFPDMYNKFIEKIKEEYKKWDDIIIVVTGDLVDKGNYNARDTVKEFFSELKSIIDDRVRGIHIVPGNHDLVYNVKDSIVTDDYKSKFNDQSAEEYFNDRKYMSMARDYIGLRDDIYGIFNRKNEESSSKEEKKEEGAGLPEAGRLWDVSIDEIGERKYCFLEMCTAATSWYKGTENYKKIYIGKEQYMELESLREEKGGAASDLTFLIMHHPMDWINAAEETVIQNICVNTDGWNVDFVLRGHTHDQDIYGLNKNYKSLVTFATGFGRRDNAKKTRPDAHMFAAYKIHHDANSMEIYNYSTGRDGKFVPDITLFSELQRKEEGERIVFPLRSVHEKGYFKLSSEEDRDSVPFYFNSEVLEDFRRFHGKLQIFCMKVTEFRLGMLNELFKDLTNKNLDYCKNFTIEELELLDAWIQKEPEDKEKIAELLRREDLKKRVYEMPGAYLSQICICFAEIFIQENEYIEKGRAHFRYGIKKRNKNDYIYKTLTAYHVQNEKLDESQVSEADWGYLIEASFNTEKTLIYSANKKTAQRELDLEKWDNYITAVPRIPDLEVRFTKKNENHSRPLLSFGITIKNKDKRANNLMYYLDYINVAVTIKRLLEDFLKATGVQMDQYIKYMEKMNECE